MNGQLRSVVGDPSVTLIWASSIQFLATSKNDDYYPTFAEKLTHLFFSTCRFHCFVDGNKRIAIVLCAQMLRYNGYLVCAETFLRDTENIAYHVAAGKIDKELLRDYLTALLNGTSDDEELKLRIIHAISDYLPGQ
ncbi:MAG: Fic family protein [Gemmatimonas sp.]|jgi:death-on-curing protein|uniref:Fic family protein n=1 Tax=Gemmatimonas sp. TaxID=1962908 RepID=UPI00391FBC6B